MTWLFRPTPMHLAAAECVALGLSVVPIHVGGSKRPVGRWKEYQARRPHPHELLGWFEPYGHFGLAVVTGAVSGHLQCVDCDSKPVADEFAARLHASAPDLPDRLVVVESPRGRHYYYRCAGGVRRNTVLAADPLVKRHRIDLKGEGGLVVAPPSGGRVHETGLSYTFATARTFASLPVLSDEEVAFVLAAAFGCDRRPRPPVRRTVTAVGVGRPRPPAVRLRSLRGGRGARGGRPGDRFEAVTDWAEVLEPHGWVLAYQAADGTRHWTRPGKGGGTSATTGYGLRETGRDLLRVFSTGAPPFEVDPAYTKFTAFALLAHGGDFRAAARAAAGVGRFVPRSLRRPAGGPG